MELFDTHLHLADPKLFPQRQEIIKRAKQNDIIYMLTVGYDDETNRLSIEIAKENEGIWAAVGIHPNEIYTEAEINLPITKEVKAIGETGLDYYRDYSDKVTQIRRFCYHICIAKELNLPLVIHTRQAFHDIIPILEETKYDKGVFHCFSGTTEEAKRIIDLGFYISFSGSITYGSKRLLSALNIVPNNRILFETDAPYLAPRRGSINEPANLKKIITYAAEVLEIPTDELALVSTENGKRLFGL